ncbi:MAG: TonB-dependent receptor [Bacteroidetes bacterium]|nr:TonB-dependent receptor [Bacteroidota bacterium]
MIKSFTRFLQAVHKQVMVASFLLVVIANSAYSQGRTVTGTVRTSDTRETLPGTTVRLKDSQTGTVTDMDGKYSLQVKQGKAVLVFSFVGYTTQEVEVNTEKVIDVVLEPSKISLQEVVVVGYGTMRKSDLTGSVGTVKSDDITKITSIDPVQSLQGKVSGVQVTSTSGTPGEIPVVRIRGVGTFNNTSPIYVVDGVIMDDISMLNSADIKSMEVLKDASATAIYGSRGANGVIMVTTKTGSAVEGKTTFSISGEYGIQSIVKEIKLLSGRDFAVVANQITPGTYNNVDAVANTDWQKLIFKVAPVYNFQVSASGASKNVQYYLGLGYYKQDGIIDKSNYQRFTVKFNNTFNLTSFLKFGTNITLTPFSQQIAPDVTYQAYRALPTIEPYYANGNFAAVDGVGNPLADLAYSNNFNKGVRGIGNMFAELTILKSIIVKSSFGVDGGYYKSESFTPKFTVYEPNGSPSQQQNLLSALNKGWSDNLTWLWENTVTYLQDFKKHSINIVVGYTMQNTTSEGINLTGKNIIRDGQSFWYINPPYIYDPANNVNTINQISNGVSADAYYSMVSFLGRVNYTFDKRYIFTLTFRRDGSSKFSEQNRWSNFPSVAAGWNISQEKFLQNAHFLSNLKLRASWGQIGNEKISYYGRYSMVDNGMVAVFGTNASAYPAASYGVSGNPDLKWEVTSQTDIGLETGFFNNRLTGEFDFYNKTTNDILVQLSTPGYFGNGPGQKVTFNAASVLNRGFEFNVGWKDKAGPVKYGVSFLGTTIHNEVLKIGGNSGVDSVLMGGYLANGIPVTQSKVGLPIGAFYGYQTDGVFQSKEELNAYPHDPQAGVGDLRFVDVNHDGVINGKDRTYLGSPIPKFIFGFNFDLEYKGFDFSVNIQGQTGNKIFNAKDAVRPDPYNFEANVLSAWYGPGTSNKEPRASYGGYNYTPSDRFIQDGSFIRIRNVILGYTLPQRLSSKIYMQKLRFYLKVDNLYTLTKFTGYSPEIGSNDVLSSGIDYGGYPVTALYAFGINITM